MRRGGGCRLCGVFSRCSLVGLDGRRLALGNLAGFVWQHFGHWRFGFFERGGVIGRRRVLRDGRAVLGKRQDGERGGQGQAARYGCGGSARGAGEAPA